ncbi:hypothetical protein [Intrasporangium calvum]|uniref:hypothetical protein n=1 Tax=Intrasporangium calvum TaxID=53358 RepID=UPI0002FDBC6A|nr:hypothetical protein [Intrasporangium calvum]
MKSTQNWFSPSAARQPVGSSPETLQGPPYWLRVWALRGLLWVWGDEALPSVEAALAR